MGASTLPVELKDDQQRSLSTAEEELLADLFEPEAMRRKIHRQRGPRSTWEPSGNPELQSTMKYELVFLA